MSIASDQSWIKNSHLLIKCQKAWRKRFQRSDLSKQLQKPLSARKKNKRPPLPQRRIKKRRFQRNRSLRISQLPLDFPCLQLAHLLIQSRMLQRMMRVRKSNLLTQTPRLKIKQ